jgi:hypothetical protein
MLVVAESSTIMIRTSTKSKDKRQQNESANDHDLDRREPEFEFTKVFDSNVVDQDDNDQEDGNKYARVDSTRRHPVLNDKRGRGQLIRSNNDVFEPVGLALISLKHSNFPPRDNLHIREQNQVPGRRSV